MSSDSPLFDRIRVKPDQDRRLRAQHPPCDWPGCSGVALHRAPKGRNRENEYWHFCLHHVREYNQSYNYFAGMSDDAVAQFQKESLIGHRPTWKMGMSGARSSGRSRSARFGAGPGGANDPFDLFREFGDAPGSGRERPQSERRAVRNAERKALNSLGLEAEATMEEIKVRFKELVKQHHPDANGGDRSSEDKLREIIQAYKYLKSVGFP